MIWNYYRAYGRVFPWRLTMDPYKILVSEIMLQQTQAPRVVEKYKQFLKKFPSLKSLAQAPLKKVLIAWLGLGYNRRAVNLQKAAQVIIKDHKGKFPKNRKDLEALPGVGPATAGDILAFAYNIAVPLIETNIRSVYIHCFFNDEKNISDADIMSLIEKTLDKKNPRDWYYALMDYGAMLKATRVNPSRRSKHYVKQSSFRGSNREIRSKILKYTLLYGKHSNKIIAEALGVNIDLIEKNIKTMKKEGLLK